MFQQFPNSPRIYKGFRINIVIYGAVGLENMFYHTHPIFTVSLFSHLKRVSPFILTIQDGFY